MSRVIATLALAVAFCAPAYGDCLNSVHTCQTTASKVTINAPSHLAGAASEAAEMWNECGGALPTFVANSSQNAIPIEVTYHAGESTRFDGACGQGGAQQSWGEVTSGTITLWEKWGPPHPQQGQPCTTQWGRMIAHEVGHVLGLDNSPCGGFLMGGSWANMWAPNSAECSYLDGYWVTSAEEEELCNLECTYGCTSTTSGWTCQDPVDPPGGDSPGDPSCPHGCSPLVLDLDGDGIHTTSAFSDPVQFDLTGDGNLDLVGWTNPSTEEGLLYYDLNRNRVVDGGAELFGEFTVLPDGRLARHGFEALAVYDRRDRGGNGDGVISPGDGVWGRLRLWVDRNHDGVATNDENYSLGQAKVIRLNLAYAQATPDENDGLDASGNRHFYRGTFVQRPAGTRREVIRDLTDIYFAVRPWSDSRAAVAER